MPRRFITPDHQLATQPATGMRGDSFMGGKVRSLDKTNRTVTAVLSTPAIDSYDERVLPSAFAKRLDRFLARPVLIANHMYQLANGHTGQVGRWEDIKVTKDALIGTCRFFDSPLANDWWVPIEQTGEAAFSVGWKTHGWEMQDVTVDGETRKVQTYTDVELVEVSVVTVPSNPEAILAASVGAVPQALTDAFGEPNSTIARLIKQSEEMGASLRDVLLLMDTITQSVDKRLSVAPGGELHQLIQATIKTQRTGTQSTQSCGHPKPEPAPDLDALNKAADDFLSRA